MPHRFSFLTDQLYRWQQSISEKEADRRVGEAIRASSPLMVSRFGTIETAALTSWKVNGIEGLSHDLKNMLKTNAGVFPINQEILADFYQISVDAMHKIDLLGIRTGHNDIRIARHFGLRAKVVPLIFLSPLECVVRYSRHLAGKKVLVIHPFERSIRKQYSKRKFLFSDPSMLPEFDLDVLPAVQSLGEASKVCGHPNWVLALQSMSRSMESRSFDVALIGAGAYGLPLAAKAKELGRVAIHIGGALQLLFGIRGKRWENYHLVSHWINEAWVWPEEAEKPVGADQVEKGCYW